MALRQSAERFRQIAETIDEIFWISDLENKNFVYLSRAFERIWGYPREYFYDGRRKILETVHPEDREKFLATFAIMDSGQPLNHEHRIIRSDHSIRHLWVRGFPIADKAGAIKNYVGVGIGIGFCIRTTGLVDFKSRTDSNTDTDRNNLSFSEHEVAFRNGAFSAGC